MHTKYQEVKISTTVTFKEKFLVISLSINDTSANNVFKGLVGTQCDAGIRSSLSPCQVLRMSGEMDQLALFQVIFKVNFITISSSLVQI